MTYYTRAEKEAYKAGCRRIQKENEDFNDTLMKRIEELAKQVDEQCQRANDLETVAAMRGDALISSRQINEQLNEERNACMLKMDEMRFEIVTSHKQYDELNEARKEMQNRHWEAVRKMTNDHNSERNRWQSVVDDLNRKLNARVVDPVRRISELLDANSKLVERLQASENERRRIERVLAVCDPHTVNPAYVGHSGNVWPMEATRPDLVHDEVDMTSNREAEKRAVDKKWSTYGLGDKSHPQFKAGYDAGLHDSKLERQTFYEDGKRDGRAEGYSDGYKNGYSIGYGEGQRN